jgi:hypothetical protein
VENYGSGGGVNGPQKYATGAGDAEAGINLSTGGQGEAPAQEHPPREGR